jgi:REP element-mobilizing transposase RayT
MARPLRIELADGLYHVTSRGDRREAIYFDDGDRRDWLEVLAQVCERFNWICHGWCQMSNHYHVVIETVEGNLSQGMRQLNGVYTQHVNRKYERVGHVFQGRYKAILVEKDGYLLELSRYVVLNPVRAGMVSEAGQWPWSSYAAMKGDVPAPPWLNVEWVLGQFGEPRSAAVARFRDFVRAGVGQPPLWDGLRGQIYLGSDDFLKRMQDVSGNSVASEVPQTQRRPLAKPLLAYRQEGADLAACMAAAYASGDYTMQAIADAFSVHYTTVSRAVRRHEAAP